MKRPHQKQAIVRVKKKPCKVDSNPVNFNGYVVNGTHVRNGILLPDGTDLITYQGLSVLLEQASQEIEKQFFVEEKMKNRDLRQVDRFTDFLKSGDE